MISNDEQTTPHTPGPWRVVPSGHQQEFTHWIERPATTEVDRLMVAGVLNTNDAEANARLIAAAPDLLAALKECVGWLDPDDMRLVNHEECRATEQQALAAIAKAEGSK